MINEFHTFIIRGNMIDLAVGIVIGAGFTTVVNSLVSDLLVPRIGLLLGHVDFSNLFVTLGSGSYPTLATAKAAGAPTLNYGLFLHSIINLIIVGFAAFMVVKQVNRFRGPEPAAPVTTKDCRPARWRSRWRPGAARTAPASSGSQRVVGAAATPTASAGPRWARAAASSWPGAGTSPGSARGAGGRRAR